MVLTDDQIKEMDKITGLSQDTIAEMDKITGLGPTPPKQPENWFTGDRTSMAGKTAAAAGNILSIPSYALGGVIDKFKNEGVNAANPLTNPFGIPAMIDGIKNKKSIMQEVPEAMNLDPNSTEGLVIGFAAELLSPDPTGELKLAGKGLSMAKSLFGKSGDDVIKLVEVAGKDPEKLAQGINKIATNLVEPAEKVLAEQGLNPKQIKRLVDNWIIDASLEVPTKRAIKIKPAEIAKEMLAHGFGKIRDIDVLRDIVGKITGDTGLTTRLTREAIGSMPGEVNVLVESGGSGKVNRLFDAMTSQMKISYDIPQNVKKDLGMEISGLINEALGTNPDSYDINKLYDIQRVLERKAVASNAKSTYLSKNLQSEAIGDVYRTVSREIRQIIEDAAKDQRVVQKVITDKVIQDAYQISPRYAQQLLEAKAKDSLSAMRSTAAPFAALGEIIELTDAGSLSAFSNLGRRMIGAREIGSAAGTAGAMAGSVVDLMTKNKTGRVVQGLVEDSADFVGGNVIKPSLEALNSNVVKKSLGAVGQAIKRVPSRAGIIISRD